MVCVYSANSNVQLSPNLYDERCQDVFVHVMSVVYSVFCFEGFSEYFSLNVII